MTPLTRRFTPYLMISVHQGQACRGYRVLNLVSEYDPLVKEVAFRALAAAPRLAGRPWVLGCRGTGSQVVVEAFLDRENPGRPLAELAVPVDNFRWIAQLIMTQLGLTGTYIFKVTALEPGGPVVTAWNAGQRDDAFELIDEEPVLRFPPASCFEKGRPGLGSRVVDPVAGPWVRCLFRHRALAAFLEAARQESTQERSWLGCGRTFLSRASCDVVIETFVGPLPTASASAGHLRTRGRDVARLYRSLGARLVAYLHLHPRALEGQDVTPSPSANDHELAWDFNRAVVAPSVFPIALFQTDPAAFDGDVGVYAYDRGVLRRIQTEVIDDEVPED